jgi:splicing factor U2AF subunit
MAEHLARIFGSEEDRVNCPFYFKMGACRHGDQCTRLHNRPVTAQTLLLKNMYQPQPVEVRVAQGEQFEDPEADVAQLKFEDFYYEVFMELSTYGEVEDMVVCDNIGEHMMGNVYVKYVEEDGAENALQKLTGRFYQGRMLQPEFCPVSDFKEPVCRQFDEAKCNRGGFCNFIHWKHVPRVVKRRIFRDMYDDYPEYRKKRRAEKTAKAGKDDGGGAGAFYGGSAPPPARQSSEERRAMIAAWNAEGEE